MLWSVRSVFFLDVSGSKHVSSYCVFRSTINYVLHAVHFLRVILLCPVNFSWWNVQRDNTCLRSTLAFFFTDKTTCQRQRASVFDTKQCSVSIDVSTTLIPVVKTSLSVSSKTTLAFGLRNMQLYWNCINTSLQKLLCCSHSHISAFDSIAHGRVEHSTN